MSKHVKDSLLLFSIFPQLPFYQAYTFVDYMPINAPVKPPLRSGETA
ncbi:hypothetical protein [Paenibacillus kribbensis]|nr:hypothetical protein [Paenibacillus kribbensis]